MRNLIRTALIVGTLATPMIAVADAPKATPAAKADDKAPAKADDKAPKADDKAAPKADDKADKTKKADKKADKKGDKKDVKEPAPK